MDKTCYTYIQSPVGQLLLAGNATELKFIGFPEGKGARRPEPGWEADAAPFGDVIRQLEAYFAGNLRSFDLALAPEGTPFQRTVWAALCEIPYGTTVSYASVARRIGKPQAVRAVGAANGRNPLPIVIPCHRVIGSDGRLTGYGGGLRVKEALLALEQGKGETFLYLASLGTES
ncbi:MAG: methylated-DNA--[protein]-cysteine S-methyltransferase [Acidobacteriia bacterium]|nr:methylated-DNA--[protein]-cysteine S-methyltransferase [Terriglobia bacterium]